MLVPLQLHPHSRHWCQQILRYHKRINNLSDDARLIKCASVEGMHGPAHLFCSHRDHTWLQHQSVGLSIKYDLDVTSVTWQRQKQLRTDMASE